MTTTSALNEAADLVDHARDALRGAPKPPLPPDTSADCSRNGGLSATLRQLVADDAARLTSATAALDAAAAICPRAPAPVLAHARIARLSARSRKDLAACAGQLLDACDRADVVAAARARERARSRAATTDGNEVQNPDDAWILDPSNAALLDRMAGPGAACSPDTIAAEPRRELALLLYQLARAAPKADPAALADDMLRNAGFRVRLAQDVLCYDSPADDTVSVSDDNESHELAHGNSATCSVADRLATICSELERTDTRAAKRRRRPRPAPRLCPSFPLRLDVPFVRAVDAALPPDALAHMRRAFHPAAPFWAHHSYGPDSPYFSYLVDLRHPENSTSHPLSAIDLVVRHLHRLAVAMHPERRQALLAARRAEWWAHARPHAHGHQLHFDSADEGRERVGPLSRPRHPIVSSVLYLGMDPDPPQLAAGEAAGGDGASLYVDEVGAPTLVTNQRIGDPLADRGWLVFPKVNRYAVFDGSVLHGVIPGRACAPFPAWRRVTFMVAFWDDIEEKDPSAGPGAARPFPRTSPASPSSSIPAWAADHLAAAPALLPSLLSPAAALGPADTVGDDNETWDAPTRDRPPVFPLPLDRVW
ncbi:hypothetical protein HK405_011425, partial [Cladochytrium tenue]